MPPCYVEAHMSNARRTMPWMRRRSVRRSHGQNMRFVKIKSCEQQGTLVFHRVRLVLMRQRVQPLERDPRPHGRVRGLVTAPVGRNGLQRGLASRSSGNPDDDRVPAVARASLAPLVCQFDLVNDQVLENDRRVRASARSTEVGCRSHGNTWRRPCARQRNRRHCPKSCGVQIRQGSCRLDRPCSARQNSQRRQGEAGRHHKAGRPATLDSYWWSGRWLRHPLCSECMGQRGRGWSNYSPGAHQRLQPSRLPTRWPG